MLYLGKLGDRLFLLDQSPLTKKITLTVNWCGTRRSMVYRNKRMILYYIARFL